MAAADGPRRLDPLATEWLTRPRYEKSNHKDAQGGVESQPDAGASIRADRRRRRAPQTLRSANESESEPDGASGPF